MHTLKNISIFIVLTIGIISCKKDNNDNFSGTYVGTFTVTYIDSSTFTGSTTVNILNNRQYNCSGNTNHIPAGGSGTYSKGDNKIVFEDINLWTADFDWNLILNGEYDYLFDGNNLRLTAFKNNLGQFEYKLIKQ